MCLEPVWQVPACWQQIFTLKIWLYYAFLSATRQQKVCDIILVWKKTLLLVLFCQKFPFKTLLTKHLLLSCPQCYLVYHGGSKHKSCTFNLTFKFPTLSLQSVITWIHTAFLARYSSCQCLYEKKEEREKKNPAVKSFTCRRDKLSASLSALLPPRSRLLSSCSSYHSPPLFIWPTSDKSSYYEILLSRAEEGGGRKKK